MRRASTMRWLVAILVAAGALRLIWMLVASHAPDGLDDPTFYFHSGLDIAHGEGYQRSGVPTAYFPPAWSFALGGVFWLVRHTPLPDDPFQAGLALNWVLAVASVGLAYLLGSRLFDPTTGLVTAALVALCPSLIFFSGTYFSETLFVFLELAALAAVAASDRGRWPSRRLVAFGLVVGLASLTRAVGLLMLAALFVASWVSGAGPRAALTQSAVAAAAALVMIVPWTVRNLIVMDSVIVIATNVGEDACIGHNPGATGAFVVNDYCYGPMLILPKSAEVASQHRGLRTAWSFARHHPGREVELLWYRARYTYENDSDALTAMENSSPGPFIRDDTREVLETTANLFFYGVALLGIAGLGALVRRDAGRLVVVLTLLGVTLMPLVFFGSPRFHMPAVPLLALSAAVALTRLARRLRAPGEPPAPATAPGQAG